nr:RNA-directed DNA polymerase, eukaryota, reverse transcriptase zinc-binding domain protein [Tanacetum cinerariifolium]
MESMGLCSVKTCGGNFAFDYVRSDFVVSLWAVPFGFFHHWTELEGFNKFLIDTWSEAPGDDSSAMRSMMRKLKYLKVKIHEWNNGNGNNTKRAIEKYKEELDALDAAIDKERDVSKEKLKRAVWDCGTEKSPSNCLDGVLGDIVNEVQFAFIAERQILDGPFILNERAVDAGMFMGIKLSPSLNLSHMFYADDAVFVGQWCDGNINTLVHVLECCYRAFGLQIIMSKSKIMGVQVNDEKVKYAASKLG